MTRAAQEMPAAGAGDVEAAREDAAFAAICPETVAALGKVARRYDLDLGALFARPIVPPHAAR